MTDLELLAALGEETPLPTPVALAPARTRLLGELRATAPPAPRRRWVVAAGVAAAVAAGVVVVTTTPWGSRAPVASASAADVLDRAAVAAAGEQGPAPRADQFVYLRSAGDGAARELWRSVDGTHDGLLVAGDTRETIPGCRGGRAEVVGGNRPGPGRTEPCEVAPAVTALPTTTAGMTAYLATEGGPETNQKAKLALELALGYLRPAVRAALFRAVAQLPGVDVVADARDGAGRPGTGISWSYGGGRPTVLVFDRSTYRLLGTDTDSVQAIAIVDRVGQRD